MKHLLFFQQDTIIGGAETQLLTLCKNLPKNEYKITVATTTQNIQSKFLKEFQPAATVVSVADSTDFARTVRAVNPHIVQHFHNDTVSKGLDLVDYHGKVIEVVHGKIHFTNDVTRTPKNHTNHIVAVSEGAKNFFLTDHPTWEDRITIIPNGIDTNLFAPEKIPVKYSRPLIILHCGRLCEGDKKYKKIIDACKTLSVAWELHLVGNGSDFKEIFDYAAKYTPGRVKFYGFRENVIPLYQNADIYISRSPSEGFGLSIAEAASCGLPLVLWDCGGVTKYLTHQINALISKSDADFINSLNILAANLNARRLLGSAARKAAIDQFGAQKMATAYDTLYKKLMGEPTIEESVSINTPVEEKSVTKRIVGVSNPNFAGVTHATRAWVGEDNIIEIPPNTPGFCPAVVHNILVKNPNILILGGDSGYLPIIKELRKKGFNGKTLLTWHGTFSFNAFAPKDGDLLAEWVQALKNGIVDKIGFVRPEMHKAIRHPNATYFPNKVPPRIVGSLPAKMKGAAHIGIFGTGYAWKNMETMVIAASLVPNSVIHVNKFESKLAHSLGVNVITHEIQSHEKFYQLLGAMDCNIQGGFTESFGLTFCESVRLGVPCLTTPGVQVFDKHELCMGKNPFEVGDPDNISAIADKIQELIKEKNNIAWGNIQLDRQSELNDRQIEKVLREL